MVRDILAAMTFRKLFVLSAFDVACSSAPTNFAGTYTLTIDATGFKNSGKGSSSNTFTKGR